MSNKKKILIVSIACIVLLLIIFCTAFAIFNIRNSNIISKISINGIDVSNLSITQANEKLSSSLTLNSSLHFTYKDYQISLLPSEIDFSFDITSALQDAFSIGRSSNIFVNNFEIFSSLIRPRNITAKYSYNDEKLHAILDNISLELPGVVVEPSYYQENDSLIICRGYNGISLCLNDMQNLILSTFSNLNSFSDSVVELNIPVQNSSPSNVDIDKIYDEIYSEPQNAYIEQNPFRLHPNVDGVDFAISIDEAKSLLQQDLKEYSIPLKITEADITTNDLAPSLFVETFSSFSSKYNISNTNRSTNVEIATSKIDDVILLPGEIFSYNKVVGERTISAGFKEASIYTSNGIEYGIGGGICQVSSTLYNAVLEANLEVVERKNHRYYVSYVPLGRDATVSYGYIDFKFKNSRDFPIQIKASASDGVVSVSVLGMKDDFNYDVSIVTEKISSIPFETKFVYDSSVSPGSQVVKQSGYYGYKVEVYKIVKLNGSVVSNSLVSSDSYSPLNKIVEVYGP